MSEITRDPWRHKDSWLRRGGMFNVEVARHTERASDLNPYEGENRWTVYAYIFKGHRLFGRFDGLDMWQDAATSLPLHRGPSFLRAHRDDAGVIRCYQVGSDYRHLHDERFTHYGSREDAYEVFVDAEALFDYLED